MNPEDHLTNTVTGVLQRVKDDAVARRWLRTRARRLSQRGLALYILAVLLLSLGFACTRQAVSMLMAHYDVLQSDIERTLRAAHEGRRDDKYFGVVAALLADLNSGGDVCLREGADCDGVDEVLAAAVTVTTELLNLSASPSSGCAESRDEEWASCVSKSAFSANDPRYTKAGDRIRALLMALYNTRPNIVDCDSDRADFHDPIGHDGDFGHIYCGELGEKLGNPRVLVSPLAVHEGAAVATRVDEAVAIALGIAPAVALLGPSCERRPTEYQIVSAYFISPDDVLALWECLPTGGRVRNRFARTRSWTASQYFERLVQHGDDEYVSQAYLDYGGNGIVRTECRPVGTHTSEEPNQQTLYGVVCVDVAVPEQVLRRSLTKSALLKTFTVKASLDASGNLASGGVELRQIERSPHWLDRWTSTSEGTEEEHSKEVRTSEPHRRDARRVTAALDRVLSSPGKRDHLGRQITPLRLRDGERGFFIPTGRSSRTEISGLLVSPAVSFPPAHPWIIAALCLCGGAVLCWVWGNMLARRLYEAEVVADLLRSLDVGIVIVDQYDRVEAVNDRAEQVLGIPLPKIGPRLHIETGLRRSPTDDDVVHIGIYQMFEDVVWEMMDDGSLHERSYSAMMGQRSDGNSSTYYARLRTGERAGKPVLCTAAPILIGGDARRGAPRTFGIVQSLSDEEEKRLRNRVQRAQERAKRLSEIESALDAVGAHHTAVEQALDHWANEKVKAEKAKEESYDRLDEAHAETNVRIVADWQATEMLRRLFLRRG